MTKTGAGLLGALLLLTVVLGGAHANINPVTQYRIDLQDRLVTDVFINGRGPFTFVIDSASSRTIIYEHVRAQLNLQASDPEPIIVYGINQQARAMAIAPDRLNVGGQDIVDLTMGVLPDSEGQGDPDGILGIDVLSRYFVVLDRAGMQLQLLPLDGGAAKAYARWHAVPLTPRPLKNIPVDFWYVTIAFNGHVVPALFDLGCGVTLLNWQAAERLGLEKNAATRKYGPPPEGLRDVLGKIAPAVLVKGVKVTIPDQTWHKQDILVSDAPVFDFFGMGEKAGAIVGPGLLKDNSLAVDFAGHQLYVGPVHRAPSTD
ncbi:MAG TPA: retroviral-like aspartic protease family protein [Rhizomicrobium sp.]|nr:retroviral-like aspartic protease family protein [Rhizomicrobium sp.]